MDIATIQGALGSLKLASDITKGIIEAKSISDVQGKVIELQSAILSAQSSALSAQSEHSAAINQIGALKEEITKIKAWESEKKRYKLHAPWPGSLVYALKKSMSNSEPPHWICTSCYEDGRKSIINPMANARGFYVYICPKCRSEIPSPWRNASEPDYAPE